MRRHLLLLCWLVASSGFAGDLDPRPILEYRIPDSRGSYWTIGIHPWFQFESGHEAPFRNETRIIPRYELFQHGERLWLDTYVDVELEATPFAIDHWPMHTPIWADGYYYGADGYARASADWFPGRLPLGLRSVVWLSLGCGTSRSDTWGWGWGAPAYRASRVGANARLTCGPVFGRSRDATPVVQALRIEEILVEERAVDSPLGPAAIEELAQVVWRLGDIRRVRDYAKGDKYFYQELERVLLTYAPELQQLPARVWLRIRETVVSQGAGMLGAGSRRTGAQVAVVGGLSDAGIGWRWYKSVDDTVPDPQRSTSFGWQMPVVSFSYGHPFSSRLHLLVSGDATVNHTGTDWPVSFTGGAGLDYLVFDRLRVQAGLKPKYAYTAMVAPAADVYQFSTEATTSFDYYVEDNVTAGVGAGFEFVFEGDSTGRRQRSTSFELSASVSARLF